eukprot:scaffold2636_cov176-Ochromonas_danica.AAC.7
MLVLGLFCLFLCIAWAEIYDPLNVFCGSVSCYDVLNVTRDATLKEIKKSYRKISITYHPDKYKESNATEVFRLIAKAYEVLSGNESRPLFDYYLDHPRDYYKVSGQHYYRNLPKADATLQNLSLKNGGTKQTLELYRRATELYDEHVQQLRAKGDKTAGKAKAQDPAFEKCVEQVVAEVKIEGGYRKPEWRDLFAWQLLIFPYTFTVWCQKYYRRYISSAPLPLEDKVEMSRDRLGLAWWEDLSPQEQQKFLDMEIWKEEVFQKYMAEQEALLEQQTSSKKMKSSKKLSKVTRRRGRLGVNEQDDDNDDYGYVE